VAAFEERCKRAADLDPDTRALAVSLARRIRVETRGAGPEVRMLQGLMLQTWLRAQDSGDLVVLVRACGEFLRLVKTLRIPLPGDRGLSGRRRNPFSPPRPTARVPERDDDEGEDDDEHGSGPAEPEGDADEE
jgi:hypothetical protein